MVKTTLLYMYGLTLRRSKMQEYKVVVDKEGTELWYKPNTNVLHRENGPAAVWLYGRKEYCINGRLHRENGPAVIGGHDEYWLNGTYYATKA
jgi:hypothetical protein